MATMSALTSANRRAATRALLARYWRTCRSAAPYFLACTGAGAALGAAISLVALIEGDFTLGILQLAIISSGFGGALFALISYESWQARPSKTARKQAKLAASAQRDEVAARAYDEVRAALETYYGATGMNVLSASLRAEEILVLVEQDTKVRGGVN